MTESILSNDEDRGRVDQMKQGLNKESRPGGASAVEEAFGGPGAGKPEKRQSLYEQVADLVENIDELSERAHNMRMTRSEYMNCLRQVTKVKIASIKEAKEIFQKRVNKLLKAQQYELKSQEAFGISAAHRVFEEKGAKVRELFQIEIGELMGEYRTLHDLIRFHQRKLKSQCQVIC